MQTIGERLEDARKQRGISIREAAESTKIRGEYLQKFESNHFDVGLSRIYVRGFLRTYATFLKLPAERILNDYAALGNDEPRTRQPSREIYGRMDVSVASSSDRGDRGAPPAEEPAGDNQRSQQKHSRSRTNLPPAPVVDPALVLKIGKIAIVVVVLLLLVWGAKSFFGSPSPTRGTASTTPISSSSTAYSYSPAPGERYVTLVPLGPVTVRVLKRNRDNTEGAELFNGTLTRDQNVLVPWPTSPTAGEKTIFIYANPGENLLIDSNGQRFPLGFTGSGKRVQM